jgi:hypothetical protein
MFNFLRISTPPSDLERALQASIDRKQRLDELARTRAEERPSPMRPVGAPSWIAQDSTANVHGFATGDLVYVGRRVPSLDGSGTEPSAIDPTQPIDLEHPNSSGSGISYWPSYGSISAASRTAYLQWLAGGRRDSQVYIG